MAGITTSPQLRESPETLNVHAPSAVCAALAGHCARAAGAASARTASRSTILRAIVAPCVPAFAPACMPLGIKPRKNSMRPRKLAWRRSWRPCASATISGQGEAVMSDDQALRQHLSKLLSSAQAHVDFEAALAGLPAKLRGERPAGLPFTPWQLLEHLRISQ